MRILQLSPQCPYPKSDGGKIGIASIIEHLSSYEDVSITFAFFSEQPISPEQTKLLHSSCHRYIEIPHSTKNTFSRIIHSVLTNNCLYLEKHQSTLAISILSQVMIEEQIQIIHVDHSAMMPLALELQTKYPCKIGYRLHNIEWMLWYRYAESIPQRDFKRKYLLNQAQILKEAEQFFLQKADIVFPISSVDFERAKELTSITNGVIVSAGTNIEYWKPSNQVKKTPTIVLATTFDWTPNREGLEWFLKIVFPLIIEQVPEVQLQILGKNAKNYFSNSKNISVIGYVDDVRMYVQTACITICPLFVGSGIRIKILESLSAGTVVVSTSIGAEGIEATESEGLFITDDREQFARYCISFLTNLQKSTVIGQKAISYTEHHWQWSVQIKKMYTAYTSLLNSSPS